MLHCLRFPFPSNVIYVKQSKRADENRLCKYAKLLHNSLWCAIKHKRVAYPYTHTQLASATTPYAFAYWVSVYIASVQSSFRKSFARDREREANNHNNDMG